MIDRTPFFTPDSGDRRSREVGGGRSNTVAAAKRRQNAWQRIADSLNALVVH